MPRLFLCALLIFAPIWGNAAPCEEVASDSARLACYDALGACTDINNPADRLACFDQKVGKDTGMAAGQPSQDVSTSSVLVRMPVGPTRVTAGKDQDAGKVPVEPVASQTRVTSAAGSASQVNEPEQSAAPRDDFGVRRVKPAEIRTSIVGDFDGWDGSQRFEMANGQIWEHRKLTRRSYPKVVNPNVLIRKNLFGFYMMDVEGTGATLPVKRIK